MILLKVTFPTTGPWFTSVANNLIQYCQHSNSFTLFYSENKQTVQLHAFTPKLPVTVS